MNPFRSLGYERRPPVKRARRRHFAFAAGFREHPRNRFRKPIRLAFRRNNKPPGIADVLLQAPAGGLDFNPKNSFQPASSPAVAGSEPCRSVKLNLISKLVLVPLPRVAMASPLH